MKIKIKNNCILNWLYNLLGRTKLRSNVLTQISDIKVKHETIEIPKPPPSPELPKLSKSIIPIDTRYIQYLPDAVAHFDSIPVTHKTIRTIKDNSEDEEETRIINTTVKSVQFSKSMDLLSSRRKSIRVKTITNNFNNYDIDHDFELLNDSTVLKPIQNKISSRRTSNDSSVSKIIPIDSYKNGIPVISAVGVVASKSMSRRGTSTPSLDDLNLNVNRFHQSCLLKRTKTPNRHVDVTLMNERYLKQTAYRGPYNLDPTQYLQKKMFIEHFEHQ